MATIADLNVRIGSDIRGLQQGLKRAESALSKSNATLSNLGAQLSNTLSIAFAGIGVGALKSFGDIEKLQKGLESQLGSAEAARAELEKIREAAKAPGLGFEQFVKGSIQLQAVGENAEKARNTISVFGNALALAGKGAGELDGVVTALTQIKAKGVVSAEEINQIAERLPQIRTAMQDAFGTANTELIQKMGITAGDFIDGITKSLEKLPKASDSFSNQVTNAFDNVTQGAAKLGERLNASLRIGERLTALSEWAIGAADAFGNLDESTQRWIIGIGLAAAALGPAIRAGNALVQVGGAMINAWTRMNIVFKEWLVLSANAEGKTGLIGWWKGLNTVMKANIIGVAIGLVLALGAAFVALRKDMSDAAIAQRSINDVNQKAAESIAGQKATVEQLVAAYKTEGATLEQKRNILNELKQISPEYFGSLKTGKGDVEAITAATAAYANELLRVAKVTAAKERIVELEKALLNLPKAADPTFFQTVANAFKSGGNAAAFWAEQGKTLGENFGEQKRQLEAERDALAGLVAQQTLSDAANNKLSTSTKTVTQSKKDLKAAQDELKKAEEEEIERGLKYIKFKNELEQAWIQEAAAIEQAMAARAEAGTPMDTTSQAPGGEQSINLGPSAEGIVGASNALQGYSEAAAYAAEVQQQLNDKMFNFNTGLSEMTQKLIDQGDVLGGIFVAMGDAIGQAASQGETSFSKLGQAAAGAAAKIVRSWIQQGVAAAVAKGLSSVPFPFNIAAGAAAGGLAAALFTKLIGAIGVKGFARGTQNAPAGLALVGEQGPELINMPKGAKVYPNSTTNTMLSRMAGNSQAFTVETRLQGSDMLLLIQRASTKKDRYS